MGSSNFHTVFQGINGDFYGCGAARNFMLCPKSDNEILEEPTKIALKFEPTDVSYHLLSLLITGIFSPLKTFMYRITGP